MHEVEGRQCMPCNQAARSVFSVVAAQKNLTGYGRPVQVQTQGAVQPETGIRYGRPIPQLYGNNTTGCRSY